MRRNKKGQFVKGIKPWNTGKKWSQEAKDKMSKSHSGKMLDEKHHNWKGNAVGKVALHDWVRSRRGTPSKCEHCGTTTAKRFEWANKSHEYKRDLSDWIRLCKKCHVKFDGSLNNAFIVRGLGHLVI